MMMFFFGKNVSSSKFRLFSGVFFRKRDVNLSLRVDRRDRMKSIS